MRSKKKLSEEGKYLPFAGFTVVADVFEANSLLFQNLYDRMRNDPLIVEYNALLPPESYHITQFSIIEQEKENWTDEQFETWISQRENLLFRLHQQLSLDAHSFSFRMTVDRKRLTLFVDIDESAAETQREVAESHGFSDRIPKRFHITLGYKYKEMESKEVQSIINSKLENILNECLPDYENVTLQSGKPKLCFYHDMTKFIPYDGRGNPFTTQNEVANVDMVDNKSMPSTSECNTKLNNDLEDLVTFE